MDLLDELNEAQDELTATASRLLKLKRKVPDLAPIIDNLEDVQDELNELFEELFDEDDVPAFTGGKE